MNPKSVAKLILPFVSLTVTWGVLEIGARIYKSEYRLRNFWAESRDLLRSAYPAEFDEELGWVPKPDTVETENMWGTQVTILPDSTRANGNSVGPGGRAEGELVLAVGDSFTFGDQVSDDETWPAFLEELTGIPTVNGGVFGYGLDQSYLRMKTLAKVYAPTHIVLSFIPEDIARCQLSERTSVAKPYFELSGDDGLRLRNDHITEKRPDDGYVRLALGYSFLIHKLMSRAFPEYWFQGSWRSTEVHADGEAIACALFREIDAFLEQTAAPPKFYLLIQYWQAVSPEELELVEQVLSCAHGDRLQIVDLRDDLARARINDNAAYERMFNGHMTAEGNRFVARALARAMAGEVDSP